MSTLQPGRPEYLLQAAKNLAGNQALAVAEARQGPTQTSPTLSIAPVGTQANTAAVLQRPPVGGQTPPTYMTDPEERMLVLSHVNEAGVYCYRYA